MRCAGQNHRARLKASAPAEKLDQRRHVENHVVRIPVLHRFAVQDRADAERIRIRNLVGRHKDRPERTERVERLAATPLTAAELRLPVTGTHIIRTRVPEHVVEGVFLRHIFTRLPDDDGQFALVVNRVALQVSWQKDRVARVLHCAGHFHKQHGKFRLRLPAFGCVFSIVQADARNGFRFDRGEEFFDFDTLAGVRELAEDAAVNSSDSGRVLNPVAGAAGRVDKADNFHGESPMCQSSGPTRGP